jgi:hypothetical protein
MPAPRKKNDLADVLETCVSDMDLSVSQVGLSTDVRALHHNGALSARASCHQGAILSYSLPFCAIPSYSAQIALSIGLDLFWQGYSVLFCPILFYSVLFCSILQHSMLFYPIPFYSVPICSILSYSILFCAILYYSLLCCDILPYSVLTLLTQGLSHLVYSGIFVLKSW